MREVRKEGPDWRLCTAVLASAQEELLALPGLQIGSIEEIQ